MDSVHNYSDDEKRLSKDSLYSDSQSDCSTNSKDVFRSITSRYLSRVHSVSDPPLVKESIIDQAFCRANSLNEPVTNVEEISPEIFKFEIDNVTVDETNDDGNQKDTSPDNTEEPSKILAEVFLPPFEAKNLTRQDAVDFSAEKIKRQEALRDCEETPQMPDEADLIDLNNTSAKLVSKSESCNVVKPRDRTIFSRSLSGIFNGKPKSYSMENLNANPEFKDVLKEATSIEFIGGKNISYSDLSLYTEGSDSVFSSPIKKNSTEVLNIFKTFSQVNIGDEKSNIIDKAIPVVKAESILPYPYPDDIKSTSNIDLVDNNKQDERLSITPPDVHIDREIKKANEEIKTSFRAAIQRITGGIKKRSPTSSLKDSIENLKVVTDKTEHKKVDSDSDVHKEIEIDRNSNETIVAHPLIPAVRDVVFEPKIKEIIPKTEITKFTDKTETIIETTNPFANVNIKPDPKDNDPEISIDDSVSYHLKINSLNDIPRSDVSQIGVRHRDIINLNQNRTHRLKTFMTPIKIVNGQGIIDRTSPIIPVLIQPIFFKPQQQQQLVELKPEIKPKATVYYNDMDQVISRGLKVTDEPKPTEAPKIDNIKDKKPKLDKKGIYQKNVKAKQLPFLSWKTFGVHDNIPDSKSPSPSKLKPDPAKTGVVKLSKTPAWLIDNQYYQPMENVPFFINTNQSFTMPKIQQTNLIKVKEERVPSTNPFLPLIPTQRRESEQENYYEEIGEPTFPSVVLVDNKNVADDDKISEKTLIATTDEFASVPREEILKVPRRVKKPKRDSHYESKEIPDPIEDSTKIVKEMATITKSVISLSRAPSAKETCKKPSGSIGEIVQNLERKPPCPEPRKTPEVQIRKLSLQTQQAPNMDITTGSWPREPKPYWKTLEHKRLSHPIRSLNDPPPPRPLRKLAGFL